MTQALHDSLINTLESGYDVSGITNALNSIADSANNTAKALDNMWNSQQRNEQNANSDQTLYKVEGVAGGTITSYNKSDLDNLVRSYGKGKVVPAYASGTRSTKGNFIIKDEKGYELTLPKLSNGRYAIENEGSQILTKEQTDNIFGWAKFNPVDLVPYNIMSSLKTSMPEIKPREVNNNNPVQIGSLINVQGNVDSSNIKQMESIANKAIDKLIYKMNNGIRYGRI